MALVVVDVVLVVMVTILVVMVTILVTAPEMLWAQLGALGS
jgi:hypothetical protein